MNNMELVNNVIMYLNNVNPYKIVEDVYGPDHAQSYVTEKAQAARDISRFWGGLDYTHRARLVDVANTYYAQ